MKEKNEKKSPLSELEQTLREWELKVRIEQMKGTYRDLRKSANEDTPSAPEPMPPEPI